MQGLDVIHGCGLVHGDIKPNNFRVSMKPDGSQVHLVITDLGNSCAPGSGEHEPVASQQDGLCTLSCFMLSTKHSQDFVLWMCVCVVTQWKYM